MSRPTDLHQAVADAYPEPAAVDPPADEYGLARSAQLDQMVAVRDRSPEWFKTLPLQLQGEIDRWAAFKQARSTKEKS